MQVTEQTLLMKIQQQLSTNDKANCLVLAPNPVMVEHFLAIMEDSGAISGWESVGARFTKQPSQFVVNFPSGARLTLSTAHCVKSLWKFRGQRYDLIGLLYGEHYTQEFHHRLELRLNSGSVIYAA
ncbi:hypothetical protein [Hafnia phage yong3]|nr:hypothetical protein [Hafnia phage yong3]